MDETLEQFAARIICRSMRDHPFVGDGPYCEHWEGSTTSGAHGTLTFSAQCGWSREAHPTECRVVNVA